MDNATKPATDTDGTPLATFSWPFTVAGQPEAIPAPPADFVPMPAKARKPVRK